MADYWLDSNIFIEGKKDPYGFDIAPRFWTLLDELIENVQISCPRQVYDELMDAQDDLKGWAQNRRASGLFLDPDQRVQEAVRDIAQYVVERYPDNQARRRFLDRADPWVIAHAIAHGGAVVTFESRAPANSQQVKIPNVCHRFDVRCITTYQMIRELGISWQA